MGGYRKPGLLMLPISEKWEIYTAGGARRGLAKSKKRWSKGESLGYGCTLDKWVSGISH